MESIVIGWKERIDLPDLKLRRVKAKIDTGARTSALCAVYYALRANPNGGQIVDAELVLRRRYPDRRIKLSLPVIGSVVVKNSGGSRETRPIVETTVRLGPVTKRVRFTLTNRSHMLVPLILGRRALDGDFVVDAGRKYLQTP